MGELGNGRFSVRSVESRIPSVIVAYADNSPQALLHSPGVLPVATRGQQEETLQVYLRLLNVSDIAEARELPTEKLQLANLITNVFRTRGSRYGLARDDDVLPRLPSQLLAEGRFHRDVKVMTSFTESEVCRCSLAHVWLQYQVLTTLL